MAKNLIVDLILAHLVQIWAQKIFLVISSKILARLTQILTPKIFRGFYLQ